MKRKTVYWVEKTKPEDAIVFTVETDDIGKFAWLHHNYLGIVDNNIFMGIVTKETKRGITIRTKFMTTKFVDMFYSNGDFDKYTKDEYESKFKEK